MSKVACVVICKECGSEIRSDWKFCPSCGDKIACPGKHKPSKKD